MSKWKKYKLFPIKEELPNKPCVYAIFFDGNLVYVGQSNSLTNRFAGHAFRFGYGKNIQTPWDSIPDDVKIEIKAKFSEKLGDWAMWEIRLIRRLKPIYNVHHLNKRKEASYEN